MFDLGRSAEEARRFDRCENIYHRGQDLAWNGRDVLGELVEKHGGVHFPEEKKQAMRDVLRPHQCGGELFAAWKISAQLADRLRAARGEDGRDEPSPRRSAPLLRHARLPRARHRRRAARHAPRERACPLEAVLATDDLACKLLGMQLQVETTALTLFQHAREAKLEPVLTELLPYFEKDEARHVGLGTQCLPMLMRKMNRLRRRPASAPRFALKITFWLLAANKSDGAFATPDPRPRPGGSALTLAKSKQMLVWEDASGSRPRRPPRECTAGDLIARVMEATASALWPPPGESGVARARQGARPRSLGRRPRSSRLTLLSLRWGRERPQTPGPLARPRVFFCQLCPESTRPPTEASPYHLGFTLSAFIVAMAGSGGAGEPAWPFPARRRDFDRREERRGTRGRPGAAAFLEWSASSERDERAFGASEREWLHFVRFRCACRKSAVDRAINEMEDATVLQIEDSLFDLPRLDRIVVEGAQRVPLRLKCRYGLRRDAP